MDLQEEGCGGADWIKPGSGYGQERALVNAVMKLRVP